jgi:hypothetical protein
MMQWPGLACGVAESAHTSQPESGDHYLIQPYPRGLLIAAVDGMGHGVEAAAAAKRATATLAAFAQESPISLILRCHDELKGTRGAVMTMALLDMHERTLTWIGVGNVEAILFHGKPGSRLKPERALLRGGVVGYQLPALRAEVLPLMPFDTLVLTTDGVKPDFAESLAPNGDPQGLADLILARFRKANDDALVVVARYTGGDQPWPTA